MVEETLPHLSRSVLASNPIAFLHVDYDLYSSTASGFKHLGKHLVDGTVIVFDDFYNYPNFENDAVRALNEFLTLIAETHGIDDRHEELGMRFLAKAFGSGVTEPVRLHVEAKRYLTATRGDYLGTLSTASLRSLQL